MSKFKNIKNIAFIINVKITIKIIPTKILEYIVKGQNKLNKVVIT